MNVVQSGPDLVREIPRIVTITDLLAVVRNYKDGGWEKIPPEIGKELIFLANYLEIKWDEKKIFEIVSEIEKKIPGETKLKELEDPENKQESKALNEQDLREFLEKLDESETKTGNKEVGDGNDVGKEAVEEWKERLKKAKEKTGEALKKTSWGSHLKPKDGNLLAREMAKEVVVSSYKLAKKTGEDLAVLEGVLTEIAEKNLESRFVGLPTQGELKSAVVNEENRITRKISPSVLDEIVQETLLLTSNQAAAVNAWQMVNGLGVEGGSLKTLRKISKDYIDGTVDDFDVFSGRVLALVPKSEEEKIKNNLVSTKAEAESFKNSTLGVIRQASALAEITARKEVFSGKGQRGLVGQDLNTVEDRVLWLSGKVAHTPMANSIIASREELGDRNTSLRVAGLLGVASLNMGELEEASKAISWFRSAGGQANSFMLGIMDGVDLYNDPDGRVNFSKLQTRMSSLNSGEWIQDLGNYGLNKAKNYVWQKIGGEKVVKSLITGLGEKLGIKQMVGTVATKAAVKTAAGATAKKVAGGLIAKGLTLLGLQGAPVVGQVISLVLIAKDVLGFFAKLVKKIKPEDVLAAVGAVGLAGASVLVGIAGAVGTALATTGFSALGPIVVGTFAYLFVSGNSTNNHNAAILPPNQKAIIEQSPRLAKTASNALPPNNGVRPLDLQEDCPWGWPINSPFVIAQGPHGPFSHRAIEAIDIFGNGYDLAGMPIFATHTGKVRTGGSEDGSYGFYVDVIGTCNGEPIVTRYAHMPQIEIVDGTEVKTGTLLGHADNSGTFRSVNSVSHLHYEVISSRYPLNKFLPKSVPDTCYDYYINESPWTVKCAVSGP